MNKMNIMEINQNINSLTPSEYKIGQTTYLVCTYFNLECDETFEDIVKRLMLREVEENQAA